MKMKMLQNIILAKTLSLINLLSEKLSNNPEKIEILKKSLKLMETNL